jgi:hypothetical protein
MPGNVTFTVSADTARAVDQILKITGAQSKVNDGFKKMRSTRAMPASLRASWDRNCRASRRKRYPSRRGSRASRPSRTSSMTSRSRSRTRTKSC